MGRYTYCDGIAALDDNFANLALSVRPFVAWPGHSAPHRSAWAADAGWSRRLGRSSSTEVACDRSQPSAVVASERLNGIGVSEMEHCGGQERSYRSLDKMERARPLALSLCGMKVPSIACHSSTGCQMPCQRLQSVSML